jgi:hypothetical protein
MLATDLGSRKGGLTDHGRDVRANAARALLVRQLQRRA